MRKIGMVLIFALIGSIASAQTLIAGSSAAASSGDLSSSTVTATGSTTPRTLGARAADVVNVRDFGAVGDGVANDTTAVQAALTAADALTPRVVSVFLPAGTYLHTSLTNPLGHAFVGPGRLVKAITGGQQQVTSYVDPGKYVFGREYLSHFHKLLIAGSATSLVFSGDSTTAGNGVSSPYTMDVLTRQFGLARGFPLVTATNRGQSGKSTYDWVNTYLAGDLAANPDVLVLRWGINDPYTGGAAPEYQRTIDQFAADLRNGLATMRGSKTVAQMSCVLMMPNSTSDTPYSRDEKWYEQIAPVLRQAARDYQCVFIDTYAYLRDSRDASGAADWMDTLVDGVSHVHPANVANAWITTLLGEVLFPDGLRMTAATNLLINASANQQSFGSTAYGSLSASAAPSTYAKGVTITRGLPANGWPYDGSVMTVGHQDGTWLQIHWSYTLAYVPSVAMRSSASSSTWGTWWKAQGSGKLNPTWGAAISIDSATAQYHEILASSAVAATIGAPNIQWVGQRLTVVVKNTSGGALGGTTWNAIYKMAAWVDPANGFSRTISFLWNGANYVEESRTPADVPN